MWKFDDAWLRSAAASESIKNTGAYAGPLAFLAIFRGFFGKTERLT